MPRHSTQGGLSGSSDGKEAWDGTMPSKSRQPMPKSRPANTATNDSESKPSWRSLFVFTTRQDTLIVTGAGIVTVLAGFIKPSLAIFLGKIFSAMANFGSGSANAEETLHEISIWCIALAVLGFAIFLCEGGMLAGWIVFGDRQARTVRQCMFTAMLDKDMEWYDLREDGMGSFLIRIQTQIRELQLATSQPLGFLFYQVIVSFTSLGIAFYFSWKLTLVIIGVFPIITVVLWLVSGGVGPAIEAQKRELSRASKYSNTAITAIDTVKIFNGQDHEVWQYLTTIKKVAFQYLKQARANALQFGITRFILIGIFVQGFWFGLYLVNHGLNPGAVLTTFYGCLAAIQALEIVLPQWLVLTKGMSAGHTLKSIMDEIQKSGKKMDMDGSLKPKSCSGDVEISDLSFAYPSNPTQAVLNNATFFFPAHETTFLVGRSGSGKSTIGNILMRYYEPGAGQVLIDGNAIETLDTDWLRGNITLVQQHSVLFNETIMQNISFGKRDGSTRDAVKEAARTGCLEETIREMPRGLDTFVGTGGRMLSGGQTQRVAIARARLRDAPILILDESTSALDHRNRIKVMAAIREWRKGKTTIIITHDMSQILDDDYVYVLENSKVVQEGYKKKLAAKSHGTFASILQADDEEASEERRQSEAEFENFVEDLKHDTPKQAGYMSWIFDSPNQSKSSEHIHLSRHIRGGHRMSLAVPIAQVNAMRAEERWASLVIPNTPVTPSRWSMWLSPREAPQPGRKVTPPLGPEYRPWSKRTSAFDTPMVSGPGSGIDTPAMNTMTPGRRDSPTESSDPTKPDSLTKIFRSVWPTLNIKQRIVLVFGIFAATVVAASTPAFSFIFARLLSTYYVTENQLHAAEKWAFLLLGIAVIDGASSFAAHYSFEYVGQAWVNALRLESLRRILAQPKYWFDQEEHSPSRLNDCLDRNAEEMRNLVGRFAVLVFTVVLMLLIAIVWAFVIAWNITLVALACGPVVFVVTRVFNSVSSRWEDNSNKAADSAIGIFTETFSSIRVVRALTLENYFGRKHRIATANTYRIGLSRAAATGLLYGLVDGVVMCIVALTFYYGGVLISNGSHTVVQILTVVNLLNLGLANASSMLALVPQISSSQATATQMLYLSSLPLNESHEVRGTTRLENPFPIQMRDLSFTYPNSVTKTLDRISLSVNPGTCTAIVGPSGSGKSTIVSLLQGLYPPDPGLPFQNHPLTFHQHSILSLNFTSLRAHMAVVPQTPVIFPTSVLSNILYGLREDSLFKNPEAAGQAAKKAGIHDFIASLEQGYNTVIGEGGQGLSGGQAQRVAIARALVRHPKLLILDEATSALDAESADIIRECIKSLAKDGVAVVMVSHSMDMMRIADRIVVVEGGEIVEVGGFEELKAQRGPFARLIGEVRDAKRRTVESVGLGIEMAPVEARSRDSWIRRA